MKIKRIQSRFRNGNPTARQIACYVCRGGERRLENEQIQTKYKRTQPTLRENAVETLTDGYCCCKCRYVRATRVVPGNNKPTGTILFLDSTAVASVTTLCCSVAASCNPSAQCGSRSYGKERKRNIVFMISYDRIRTLLNYKQQQWLDMLHVAHSYIWHHFKDITITGGMTAKSDLDEGSTTVPAQPNFIHKWNSRIRSSTYSSKGARLLFGLYGYVEDDQPFEGDAQTKRQ